MKNKKSMDKEKGEKREMDKDMPRKGMSMKKGMKSNKKY